MAMLNNKRVYWFMFVDLWVYTWWSKLSKHRITGYPRYPKIGWISVKNRMVCQMVIGNISKPHGFQMGCLYHVIHSDQRHSCSNQPVWVWVKIEDCVTLKLSNNLWETVPDRAMDQSAWYLVSTSAGNWTGCSCQIAKSWTHDKNIRFKAIHPTFVGFGLHWSLLKLR